MNDNRNNQSFQYTYSAKEQEELKRIRSKYAPCEENRMEQLRRLDAQVTQKATMYAIITGVIGALIFGVGMCCCMLWGSVIFILGIVIGVIGMAIIAAAYPLYNHALKMEREKAAPQILRLTEELMK